jgi:hypothetical protein
MPSYAWSLRTLLSFRDHAPSALPVGLSSSSLSSIMYLKVIFHETIISLQYINLHYYKPRKLREQIAELRVHQR